MKQSQEALKGHEEHVKELNDIIKHEADGAAKVELTKVRDNAKKHAKDIEEHIKSGQKLIEQKEDALEKIEAKVKGTNQVDLELAKAAK